MKKLSLSEMKKIIGGFASYVAFVDDSLGDCTKDCGNDIKVTCSGTSCTTTDYGCYAQNSNGGIDYQRC